MIKKCLYCHKDFKVFPYKIREGKGKYCSKQCYHLDKSIQVKCLVCGKSFWKTKKLIASGRGKFCSKKCKHLYTPRQKEVSCKYCKKIFMVKMIDLERGGGIYCSRECAAKDYRNHYSSKNSINWKGGKHRDKHNSDYRYSDWRLKTYERDNFTCQECGQVGGKLNAHHIFKWSEFPLLRYKLWNGITLCEKCHKKKHKKSEDENGKYKRKL